MKRTSTYVRATAARGVQAALYYIEPMGKKGETKGMQLTTRGTSSPLLSTLYPGLAPTATNNTARENRIVERRIVNEVLVSG
jgi:hypothetical protein